MGRGWNLQSGNWMDKWREEFETDGIAISGRCCFPFQQLERGSFASYLDQAPEMEEACV